MSNRPKTRTTPLRKKSVSKASADRGREDSRAAAIKHEKTRESVAAKLNPRKLDKMYEKRLHDVDQQRKVHRTVKKKSKRTA